MKLTIEFLPLLVKVFIGNPGFGLCFLIVTQVYEFFHLVNLFFYFGHFSEVLCYLSLVKFTILKPHIFHPNSLFLLISFTIL